MFELSNEQIALVTADVENAGINYSHLSTDLIDHICCDIESHMNQGNSFDTAYEHVKQEFGIKGLRQIQQDTLMLIDKKYRIMKKSMKTIGTIAMALMAFGALFKVNHWPGAAILLSVSFAFTGFIFFPTLIYVVYKEQNNKKQAPSFIIAFLGGVLFIFGVLFKIMHFPGAAILLMAGLGTIAFILLPLIVITNVKNTSINKSVFVFGIISIGVFVTGFLLKLFHLPGAAILLTSGGILLILAFVPLYFSLEVSKSEHIRIDFIFGIIALTYFVVLTFLLAINLSQGFISHIEFQEKSFTKTAQYLSLKNNQMLNANKSNEANSVIEQANILHNYIDAIKVIIYENHYNCPKEKAQILLQNNEPLRGKQNNVSYLLSSQNENSSLPGLKAEIEIFNRLYNKTMPDSLQGSLKINQVLNTAERLVGHNNKLISWEQNYFKDCPESIALNTLSLWQYQIQLCENHVLQTLSLNSKTE